MGCLSDRFIFNIGYRKNILFEFRQAVRKQPMTTSQWVPQVHLEGAGNVCKLYNEGNNKYGGC